MLIVASMPLLLIITISMIFDYHFAIRSPLSSFFRADFLLYFSFIFDAAAISLSFRLRFFFFFTMPLRFSLPL